MSKGKKRYLSDLKPGESGYILRIEGYGAFRKRIVEMGFIKGKRVDVIKQAPLNDPMEYQIMGYNISLRKSEAKLIEVADQQLFEEIVNVDLRGRRREGRRCGMGAGMGKGRGRGIKRREVESEECPYAGERRMDGSGKGRGNRCIHIALVGNPNSGKTTLFNKITGSHERVGNYGGVTVEAKRGKIERLGYTFDFVDLPGTYSITEYTPEELYVRNWLFEDKPDIVINVIDSSNLERNLYLTTQLIDMGATTVIALNMFDELKAKGVKLNYQKLGELMGIPMVPTIASKGFGTNALLEKVVEVYEGREESIREIEVNHGHILESAIEELVELLDSVEEPLPNISNRYLAVKLIEKDLVVRALLEKSSQYSKIEALSNKLVERVEEQFKESSESALTDAKYGFIEGALKECITHKERGGRKIANLDDLLTHKKFGLPIFIFFMWLMFQATFTLGEYPMELIEAGVASLGSLMSNILSEGPLRDLIVDGVIEGVGGVIVFLPNILILFFFISFMEDSGYMARAAFIMDKVMHKVGLHGKSFIPLIMGFGCNVPAVMATRTLESRNDRILTMLLIPFISCSAKLPLYVLLISAFFPKNQGLVLFAIYSIGIVIAIFSALILKRVAFKKRDVPFVMELPPYRIPTLKSTLRHMWNKAQQYVKKMGSIILIASIIIWALGYFPRDFQEKTAIENRIANLQESGTLSKNEKSIAIKELQGELESKRMENSYIGRLGHSIEPIIAPLGFDWKMGVSIISGLPAKEIVVSSMSVLYQASDATGTESLIEQLRLQVHRSGPNAGKRVFTPLVAFGFMLFILVYFPCIATIASIAKESNWRWALFALLYTTILAWLLAFLLNNIGSLFVT
ncbi:MAG: ferrous iron transport protein B [Bacteroidales bacterium]